MRKITTRQQLLDWLQGHVQPSYLSAIDKGNIELFGWFYPIPTSNNPGWIVELTLLGKRKINIVVSVDELGIYQYYTWIIDNIPWRLWRGFESENSLYRGDNPDDYKTKMDKTQRHTSIDGKKDRT